MLLGYIWIAEQHDASLHNQQSVALLAAGVTAQHIYEDLGCSPQDQRPELQRCLKALRPGQTLVVMRLSQLATKRSDLLSILEILHQREATLQVLTGKGAEICTANQSLPDIIHIIEAITEMEREAMKESLAVARAKGQKLGPKRKMTADMLQQAMTYMTTSSMSVSEIAETLGVTRATLYNYLKGDGSLKEAGIKLRAEAEETQ